MKPFSLICIIALAFAAIYPPSGFAAQNTLPPLLDKALKEAEAQSDLRVSYTMTFLWPGEEDIVSRYDAKQKNWSLISGNPKALPRKARSKYNKFKRIESVPGGLVYADYRGSIKSAMQVEENSEEIAFSFTSPQTPSDIEDLSDTVRTRLIVDRRDNIMSEYSIHALKPFSRGPALSMNEFSYVHTFERVFEDTPPLMTKAYCNAKGRRFFSTIDEEYTLLFSDFQKVM